MRLPIHRGIPFGAGSVLQSTTEKAFFDVDPRSRPAPDPDLFARVTTYVRNGDREHAAVYARSLGRSRSLAQLADIIVPAADCSAHVAFRDYPMRYDGVMWVVCRNGLGVSREFVYGHMEVGDIDTRIPNRPLDTGRAAAPFDVPVIRPGPGEGEALVHQLDARNVDLVTLSIVLAPLGQVLLRFYDGTYYQGRQRYVQFDLRNTTEEPLVDNFFDRHPMLGPGRVTALVPDDVASSIDRPFIYGSVFR